MYPIVNDDTPEAPIPDDIIAKRDKEYKQNYEPFIKISIYAASGVFKQYIMIK